MTDEFIEGHPQDVIQKPGKWKHEALLMGYVRFYQRCTFSYVFTPFCLCLGCAVPTFSQHERASEKGGWVCMSSERACACERQKCTERSLGRKIVPCLRMAGKGMDIIINYSGLNEAIRNLSK